MSVIWYHKPAWVLRQRLSLWRREKAAEPLVVQAFGEWRHATPVEGDHFDDENVQRFHAWLMVAHPDVLTEIPEHEWTGFVAMCVRHLAIKAGRYKEFFARNQRTRHKAKDPEENGVRDDADDE